MANDKVLKAGDLTMDLTDRKVTRGNKEIALTTKESALLEYMMRHADTIITRTMISEKVWDVHHDTFTNVIDVYVNYLRNKVDAGAKKKMIQTVRGKGYILKTK
jgi:two-component system, OmpR family, copper resistance phosphate regulon response regulator CusR